MDFPNSAAYDVKIHMYQGIARFEGNLQAQTPF
jgi:hypothetical protein